MAQYYVVKRGDTLRGIAKALLGDGALYRRIAEFNGLRDPDRLREKSDVTKSREALEGSRQARGSDSSSHALRRPRRAGGPTIRIL